MQSAVLARPFLSVCLSVRHVPVFVQTNEYTMVWFAASDRTILLVSEEVKFIRILSGDHHSNELDDHKVKIQTIITVFEKHTRKMSVRKRHGLIGLSPLSLATPLSAQCSVRPIKLLLG